VSVRIRVPVTGEESADARMRSEAPGVSEYIGADCEPYPDIRAK